MDNRFCSMKSWLFRRGGNQGDLGGTITYEEVSTVRSAAVRDYVEPGVSDIIHHEEAHGGF